MNCTCTGKYVNTWRGGGGGNFFCVYFEKKIDLSSYHTVPFLLHSTQPLPSPSNPSPALISHSPLFSPLALKRRVSPPPQPYSVAATSITSPAEPQVAFTVSILTAKELSRFTATRPRTEGGGLCSRKDKTAPKTSTWAGVSTKRALDSWLASSGWDLTRSIAWRPADRASYEWRWETGVEAGRIPNMADSALVMNSRCTSWVWARIQVRRETRWSGGTTTWTSPPRTGIMISGVMGTVLWTAQAPGGTTSVTTPTWTGSTWGTRRVARESTGGTTRTAPSPWNLQRWSCAQETNLHDSGGYHLLLA